MLIGVCYTVYNVLFASDWITVHRLPFGPITPDEMDSVKKVEAMDFEYFICSHGRLGKKSDVSANLRFGLAKGLDADHPEQLTKVTLAQ